MTIPLKQRILDYVRATDHVSFAELGNHFEGFTGGDHALCKAHNIILWAGMTEEAVQAMMSLLTEKLITPHPSSQLVYLIDGRSLTLPIVKRVRKYKNPHWLPVTLRPAKVIS